MKLLTITAGMLASVVLVGGADAAQTSFQLVFDGHHVLATFPTPTGLSHEGPFTSTSSLCPSGYAHDIAQTDQVATRLFTCDGSDGTFTATISPHLAEHGGAGSWQIIAGTGELADLRGKGSFSSVLTSGNPNDFLSISFRSTWQGTIDLDATPPTVAITRQTVHKLARPRGTYVMQLALSLNDNSTAAVSYTLTLIDPRTLNVFERNGGQASGTIARTFRLRPAPATRRLRLTVTATDQVGNTTTLTRTIRLGLRTRPRSLATSCPARRPHARRSRAPRPSTTQYSRVDVIRPSSTWKNESA